MCCVAKGKFAVGEVRKDQAAAGILAFLWVLWLDVCPPDVPQIG